MLTVLIGGARSGKSRMAVTLASRTVRPVVFIATGEPLDDEFTARIERHRRTRPDGWTTVEEPLDLPASLTAIAESHLVIIDCLTLWVANLQRAGASDEGVFEQAEVVAGLSASRPGPTIVVTNEVGSGIVPANALARQFQDLLGEVNTMFARRAQSAFLVVAGRSLRLDPLIEID